MLFPRSPLKFVRLCLSLLCALRLTNIGLVQCLRVCSLWNFARVCFLCFACFASQTPGLPCSARTSVPFGILHACVYVLRASPRSSAVLFPRPLLSLYACVCHVLPHKHRVCAVLFSRSPFKKFVRLCFSRFVMRIIFPHKHRVSAVPFPWPPVKFVRLSLSCYVMRTSPQEHQFRAVLFSQLPLCFCIS